MKGFTLVEMLVALFIFALIGVAGVAVIRFTTDNQDVVRGRGERLAQVQRARALLKADLAQAAPRRARAADGSAGVAFFGGPPASPAPFLKLVRRGRANAQGEARSSLQYVEYAVAGGRLERRVRAMPDGAALGPPQVLIEHVTAVSAAYLSQGRWIAAFASANRLPQAARIGFDVEGLGAISQAFVVSGEAS